MLYGVRKYFSSAFRSESQVLVGLRPDERELISRIRRRKLTYLTDRKLASLATTCTAIEEEGRPGIFLEAGCALGGSSILMASIKTDRRPLFIYDVFGMIPAPTAEDTEDVHARYRKIAAGQSKGIGGDKYYGYEKDLYETVQSNLQRFGVNLERQRVHLVKGLIQDTLKIDQPVAFAHIDVDWFAPVMTCLERVFPRLVIGGRV